VCFFGIIPILAGAWAVFLFHCHYLGWSLAFAVLYFAAAGVTFGMTLAYPIQYPQPTTNSYLTYQWIAFGMGACAQFLWSCYVLAVAIALYVKNNQRTSADLAADETMEERTAVNDLLLEKRLAIHGDFGEARILAWTKHKRNTDSGFDNF
jgi:hypothetical protein